MTDKKLDHTQPGTSKPFPPRMPQLNSPATLNQIGPTTVLRIYDPALCCSSGVCGPSVDPALAQFAGTLQALARQTNLNIERYNLGQQPQAFVENQEVKSLLANGGDQRLPFIFINGKLAFQATYPSIDELAQALGITTKTTNEPETDECRGNEGECC
jgi:hypothetical protein